MPDFAYTARDLTGSKVSGMIAAGSQREALALLTKQSLFPMEVRDPLPKLAAGKSRKVKPLLIANMFSQLSGLLRSGVPLLRSLNVLREQTSHSGLKSILSDVHDQVEEGSTLAEAMAHHPRAFGEMSISMIRAGGEGAFLEDALDRVSEFTEKQQDLKSRTIGAMAYPLFLGFFGSLIVTFLIVFFVPKFADMFGRMRQKGELPFLTDWLLNFSEFLNHWWWLGAGAIVALFFFAKGRLQTPEGRIFRDRVLIKLPIVGHIFLSLSVSRFCRVLGTLLHNGVPILKALEISGGATGNKVLSGAINQAAENISAGESLAKPLASSGHFPRNVCEMISVAEESNNLENVLTNISDDLDKRTWRQLDLAVRLLEPLMLLILAGVVLLVAIALLLPVMKMSTSI
ncbi:MAG TPA: type II secretion system F family protein [Pirellulales bacterium]|jgi:general secretion pathway protein F/type IV pilus assembly protein PilC|nr:type II secretion system F family protein [Pirellulales bacterium]